MAKRTLLISLAVSFILSVAIWVGAANQPGIRSGVDSTLYFDSTTGASITGERKIIGVFWVEDQTSAKDIAADDDFLLSDADGNRIVGKRAAGAGDDLAITPCRPLVVDGITVTTMDGGVCYIWLDTK